MRGSVLPAGVALSCASVLVCTLATVALRLHYSSFALYVPTPRPCDDAGPASFLQSDEVGTTPRRDLLITSSRRGTALFSVMVCLFYTMFVTMTTLRETVQAIKTFRTRNASMIFLLHLPGGSTRQCEVCCVLHHLFVFAFAFVLVL